MALEKKVTGGVVGLAENGVIDAGGSIHAVGEDVNIPAAGNAGRTSGARRLRLLANSVLSLMVAVLFRMKTPAAEAVTAAGRPRRRPHRR